MSEAVGLQHMIHGLKHIVSKSIVKLDMIHPKQEAGAIQMIGKLPTSSCDITPVSILTEMAQIHSTIENALHALYQ